MPTYQGTVRLATSNLPTVIGEVLAPDVEPPGTPLASGVVRVRTAFGASGALAGVPGLPGEVSAPITNGAFSVAVPDLPAGAPWRYRLLVERGQGTAAVPIYRSGDLPVSAPPPLDIVVRLLDAADNQHLANLDGNFTDDDPTVVTTAEIDAAAKAEAAKDPHDKLAEASGRVEGGFVKLDFTYRPRPDHERLQIKGTLTLEPNPSRAFELERLVELDFVRIDLARVLGAIEDTHAIRGRAEAAVRGINDKLAAKLRATVASLGANLHATITVVSATEPGSQIQLLLAMGFLIPPPG